MQFGFKVGDRVKLKDVDKSHPHLKSGFKGTVEGFRKSEVVVNFDHDTTGDFYGIAPWKFVKVFESSRNALARVTGF